MKLALRSLAASTLLAAIAGCAAPAEDAADEPAKTSSGALSAFNPCNPDWQLPTSARWALDVRDPAFLAFEDRLAAGYARWIGSFELPKPYRAIVRVDHYLDGTKSDPRSGLWYLAAIPVSSLDARRAVAEFHTVAPVNSRELGYCLADGSFVPNKGLGPGNLPVKQVIVEYDPRCVCFESSTAAASVWVDYETYSGLPTY